MKHLILIVIRIYQICIPKRLRGRCLFKESCSNYVFRITKEKGYNTGISALKYRIHNCRPNYFLTNSNGKILLITAKNEVIEEEFIDERIVMEEQKNTQTAKYPQSRDSSFVDRKIKF